MSPVIYTLGHSNTTIGHLLDVLKRHAITAVADVRSQPYSRFNPQFNRETLSEALKGTDIEYAYLGQELGARSNDPACYRGGRAQYSLIARTIVFERGIERLLAGALRFQVCMLCAEKEPLACHRSILIARYLHEKGLPVRHILEDGRVEDHSAALARLLEIHGMQDNHLFHSRDELIAMAYEKQAEQIQYEASQESRSL